MLQFWGEHKFKVLNIHTEKKPLQTSHNAKRRYTDERVTTTLGSHKTHTHTHIVRGRHTHTHERYDVPKRIVSCQREYYVAEATGAPEIDRSP